MPNWCYNNITLRGPQSEIDRIEKFLEERKGENWFDFFRAMPDEIREQKDAWYGWNLENYGCKWNCDAGDWYVNSGEINFTFDSPWGPPIALYEFIDAESEFEIEAHYYEEGMQFVGRFVDGEDEYYEFQTLEDLDEIPDDIVTHWGIREMMEDLDPPVEQFLVNINDTNIDKILDSHLTMLEELRKKEDENEDLHFSEKNKSRRKEFDS